jgi:hypothetical protein
VGQPLEGVVQDVVGVGHLVLRGSCSRTCNGWGRTARCNTASTGPARRPILPNRWAWRAYASRSRTALADPTELEDHVGTGRYRGNTQPPRGQHLAIPVGIRADPNQTSDMVQTMVRSGTALANAASSSSWDGRANSPGTALGALTPGASSVLFAGQHALLSRFTRSGLASHPTECRTPRNRVGLAACIASSTGVTRSPSFKVGIADDGGRHPARPVPTTGALRRQAFNEFDLPYGTHVLRAIGAVSRLDLDEHRRPTL